MSTEPAYWNIGLCIANTKFQHRQHPAVVNQASKLFVFVAQALEAETLQGQTANRVVSSIKSLLTAASVDPMPLLQQFSQESQRTIMGYFT